VNFREAVVVLIFLLPLAVYVDVQRSDEHRAAEAAAERRAEFEAVKDSLYVKLAGLQAESEHERIVAITDEWADLEDDSLKSLRGEATTTLKAIRDSTLEIELLNKVRTIPASNTTENLTIYRQLASLDPENERYKTKVDEYRAQQAAERRLHASAAKWSYHSSTDEMTGRTTRSARLRSENTVNFDFPYHGAQRATLTLRTHPSYGRDVIFRLEKGQILCHTYSRCRVRVRFDDGAPTTWGANPAADNSTEVIFLGAYGSFVSRLQRSKVIRVQPEIYQEGQPVFEFDVAGFELSRYAGG
jgi:hypothetical protein